MSKNKIFKLLNFGIIQSWNDAKQSGTNSKELVPERYQYWILLSLFRGTSALAKAFC